VREKQAMLLLSVLVGVCVGGAIGAVIVTLNC
jgi:hypothetical protein